MSTATLAGVPCLSAVVHEPAWGMWFAAVTLDREVTLADSVTLQLADASFVGSVVSGGPWLGRSSYRLVGGHGGWSTRLAAKGYSNDGGVKISTVIGDAAAECGEVVEGVPIGILGYHYERAAGPASTALQLLASESWHVGRDGVTRFVPRAAGVLPGQVARGAVDLAAGFIELMADSLTAVQPGLVVDGVTAVDVVHTLEGSKLRSVVWGSAFGDASKPLLAWRRLFDQLYPWLRYARVAEYRIVTQEDDRLNLQPVLVSTGLPSLSRVRVRPGLPGCRAEHALGSQVLVQFVNADPAKPVVVAFDDAEAQGFRPEELDLCAGSTGAYPVEHATSIEAVAGLIGLVLYTIGQANQGPLSGITISGPAGTPTISAPVVAFINTALAAMAVPGIAGTPVISGDVTPYVSAIEAALAAKLPNALGSLPNVGWPGVRGG